MKLFQVILSCIAIVMIMAAMWFALYGHFNAPIVGINTFGQYVYLDSADGRLECPTAIPSKVIYEFAGGEC